MVIALPIGRENVLMANDVPSILGTMNEQENRSKILISVESKEEADAIFTGLSAGGQVEAPMGEGPWGTYFGMFRDKYGIEWMVEFAAVQYPAAAAGRAAAGSAGPRRAVARYLALPHQNLSWRKS